MDWLTNLFEHFVTCAADKTTDFGSIAPISPIFANSVLQPAMFDTLTEYTYRVRPEIQDLVGAYYFPFNIYCFIMNFSTRKLDAK